jgi:hypothetical protein
MERQITMATVFKNYVTIYGTLEDVDKVKEGLRLLVRERGLIEDYLDTLDCWKIGTKFNVFRLDSFETAHWGESPGDYLSELSEKCPNAVIEWTYFEDPLNLRCSVFKNGHSLVEYEALGHPGAEDANKYFYLEAGRFSELALS